MDSTAIIRAEAQRFADVLAATPGDARCPTCPDWSASDLLWHLTEVHLFWAGVLERNVRTEADVAAVEQSKPDRPSANRQRMHWLRNSAGSTTPTRGGRGGRRTRRSDSPEGCRSTRRRCTAS